MCSTFIMKNYENICFILWHPFSFEKKFKNYKKFIWIHKFINKLWQMIYFWHSLNYFKCVNGTFTEETCENGLVYGEGHGAAHNFCNYNWEVDCGARIYEDTPISTPG